MYVLEESLDVKCSIEKAWDFISSPKNLDRITPPNLSFEIVSKLPDKMYNGQIIEYKVAIPFLGSQVWVSELKHIIPFESFVDEQKIGPYKLWYHYHKVESSGSGVKLTDRVHYAPPLGPLGKLLNHFFIRRQLEAIFSFRKKAFADLLES